jgi:Cu/Ag efflux protein CusF
MIRFVVPAALAAVVATSSLALANQTVGTIKAFDAKAMKLTLQDGTIYSLPAGFKDPGLKAGERVQVTWEMQNGQYKASAVVIRK